MHTTDGGVQSPPPPPPQKKFDNIPTKLRLVVSLILYIVQYGIIDSGSAGGGGPFAEAKVVITSVISIVDGFKNLNKHKLQREVEDLATILISENYASEKTRSRHSIKIPY